MIRPARPADRPVLEALQSHLSEPSPDLLAHAVETRGTRLLVSVPAASWEPTADAPGPPPVGYLLAVEAPAAVHVAELVVDPDHRRSGRATALLAALFDSLETGTPVTVAVEPSNAAARSLYRSVGFRPVETVGDYFEDGPAVLLRRRVGDDAGVAPDERPD